MPTIEPFNEDLDILQKLDDVPALPYREMQKEFDKSGNIIKDFLNTVIIPAINSIVAVTGETDKTLTTLNAPADAKFTGDALRNMQTSFQNALTTGLGKKIDKSGGTMTGKLTGIVTPTANADAANKQYVDESRKIFQNVVVSSSAWVEDSTYEDFGFKADIPLNGVTENMIPDVTFPVSDTAYCNVAESYNGGVTIWADEAEAVTIPTIILWRASA